MSYNLTNTSHKGNLASKAPSRACLLARFPLLGGVLEVNNLALMSIPKWISYPVAMLVYFCAAYTTLEYVRLLIAMFKTHPIFTSIMFFSGLLSGLLGVLIFFTWKAYSIAYAWAAGSIWKFLLGAMIAALVPYWILLLVVSII